MFISALGALFFGLAVGWISYRTLRLTAGTNVLSDIATIIGAVGSARLSSPCSRVMCCSAGMGPALQLAFLPTLLLA